MEFNLMLGDCMERMAEIPDNSVDMVLTDPPYSTPVAVSFGREIHKKFSDLSIQKQYMKLIKSELDRVLKPDGAVFIFCDDKYYPIIFEVFYEYKNSALLIWDKGRIGMGFPFRKRHELIFFACKNSIKPNYPPGTTHYPTIINCPPVIKNKFHGAQKPLKLSAVLMEGFSNKKDLILDPFMGSGTTGVAAINLDRRFIGVEQEIEYFKIAQQRIGEAVLNRAAGP